MTELFTSDIPDISVWDFQRGGIDSIRRSMARGKRRVLFRLPTGGGKTRVSAWIAAEAVRKGKAVLFVVYGRDLVFQAQRAYADLGIPAAVLMAGTPYAHHAPVQIASIDTLASRLEYLLDWLDPDLIITDECRESIAPKYQRVRERWPRAFRVGARVLHPHALDGKATRQRLSGDSTRP